MRNPLALIIEDDLYQADLFAIALQAAEYETEIIQDGQTALERLATTSPVLIVLDLHLPRVPGKFILEHIRSDQHLQQVKVILTTADPETAKFLADQSDLVLIKPISILQLRELASRLRPPDTVII